LKKKDFFLFFFLPLMGIVVIFFVVSSINRTYIKNKVEGLVKEQLQATAEILKADISHFLSENYRSEEIFDLYSGEENIYYMALLNDKKEILGWSSRFDGYLPLSQKNFGKEEYWILDSPAGKIFNIFSSFTSPDQRTYYIYLGYSLGSLEEMVAHSRKSFLVLFGIIGGVGIIFLVGIYQLQNHYLRKEKEAEKERREKERYREISAFTSGVAHEIKNPLNSLALLFELFEKKAPQELHEEVSLGSKEVRRISRIIDQFSASLKPLNLKKETFNLNDLMGDIIASMEKETNSTNVKIKYSEENRVALSADKELLSQVFLNLLRNSLEATEEGEIEVRAKQHRKRIFVTLKDTGKGLSEDDRKHIFDPFFSRKMDGMGIGLYLAKKIIESHDGKIECESRLGKGTTFLIQIPGG
jgi:signal transduction histidine kinase